MDCRGWLNSAMRGLDRLGCSPVSRAALAGDLAAATRDAQVVSLRAQYGTEDDAA
jgi:hypothetical protein